MRQAVLSPAIPQEGVRKNDPYFTYLARGKIVRDLIYLRTQKRHITQPFIQCDLSSVIDAVTLHIYAYIVPVFVLPPQVYAILSLTTGQFQGNRVVIFKVVMPLTFYPLRVLQYI